MIEGYVTRKGFAALVAVLCALFAMASAQAQREAVVATDGTPLRLTRDAEDAAAQLYVTTAVQVQEEDGDAARVTTTAWTELDDDGEPTSPAYTNDTDLIRVADLADPAAFPIMESGEEWAQIELEGWVDASALADDTDALYEEAAEVYQQYCTGCHAGYARPVEQIRSQMPPELLPDIAERMARGTGIADDQLNLIIHWLQDKPE